MDKIYSGIFMYPIILEEDSENNCVYFTNIMTTSACNEIQRKSDSVQLAKVEDNDKELYVCFNYVRCGTILLSDYYTIDKIIPISEFHTQVEEQVMKFLHDRYSLNKDVIILSPYSGKDVVISNILAETFIDNLLDTIIKVDLKLYAKEKHISTKQALVELGSNNKTNMCDALCEAWNELNINTGCTLRAYSYGNTAHMYNIASKDSAYLDYFIHGNGDELVARNQLIMLHDIENFANRERVTIPVAIDMLSTHLPDAYKEEFKLPKFVEAYNAYHLLKVDGKYATADYEIKRLEVTS